MFYINVAINFFIIVTRMSLIILAMIILFGLKPSDYTTEIYELLLYFVILLKNVEYIFDCYYYNRLRDCVDVPLNSQSFYNEGQFMNIYFTQFI